MQYRAGLVLRIAAAGVLVCLLGGTLAASALARSSGPGDPSAVDAATGRTLPVDPVLRRGERVILTVRGFAAHAGVQVALVHHRLYGSVRADRRGRVVYRYTMPCSLRDGSYELSFSGLGAHYPRGKQRQHRGTGTPDPQNVEVTVPFDPPWPFRLGGAAGHPPPSRGVGGVHTQHGGTSFTGVDTGALAAAALLSLGAGAALLRFTRRRGRRS